MDYYSTIPKRTNYKTTTIYSIKLNATTIAVLHVWQQTTKIDFGLVLTVAASSA